MSFDAPGSNKNKKLKTYGKTAKVGVLWAVTRNVVRYVLLIPVSMIMARLLSPTEFGIAAAATFFLTLSGQLTELGLNASLVRIKHLRPEHTSSVFVTAMCMGALAWLSLTLSAPYLGQFFRTPEVGHLIPVAALAFLINPLSAVPSALLQRNLRYGANSVTDWADTVTGSTVSILLAWNGFSYWSPIIAHLASTSINVTLKLYFTRWVPSLRFSRSALRELLSFGLGIQSKRILQFASQNLDNVLIGRLISISALGMYDKAFNTMTRLSSMVSLGAGVSFRIFAIIQEDEVRFRKAYSKTLLTLCVISMPILAGALVAAPQLFEVMYGKPWLPAVPVFQILCFVSIIGLVNAHASQANEAMGMVWYQVGRQCVYVVLLVIGVSIGSRWGIVGAAAGVLSARLMVAWFIQELLRRSIRGTWSEMLTPVIPGAVSAIAVATAVLGTRALVHAIQPSASALALLTAESSVALLPYLALLLFSPFAAVRAVVHETLHDFAPGLARRIYTGGAEATLTKAS